MHWSAIVALGVASAVLACSSPPRKEATRHLLIIVDGLRPDYVTPQTMPSLSALGARGVVFANHHSVYPTVTRVNAASISTGAYPMTHGLLGNTVFFPSVDAGKFLDTSLRANLVAIASAEGQLLTAPTMAEALQAAGKRMLVVSSGSSGSAFLNNHRLAGGAILHYEYVLPPSLAEPMQALGPPPPAESAAGALDTYAVDAFLKVGLPTVDPSVTVLWLSDLDTTAHDKGIGDPATVAILQHVDREIERVQEGLKAAGLFDDYDIWVSSDHGFSTHTGAADVAPVLAPFMRTMPDGSPRIVAGGGAIYLRDNNDADIAAIVAGLQRTPGVGVIFTRPRAAGSPDGVVPGTLSFDSVRWTHPRSAQILYSPDWNDDENANHFRGTVAAAGTAGHGSSSPWDVHNTLIAAGPGLRRGTANSIPTANVDFAPTFLTRLGIAVPSSMQGRPLLEAFAGTANESASTPRVETTSHTVKSADGNYAATAAFSTVSVGQQDYRYFDRAKAIRR